MACRQCADDQMQHAEKTISTDYLANHLHNPEMEKFNIPATNSIQ